MLDKISRPIADTDPIFALIREHKRAAKHKNAAWAEWRALWTEEQKTRPPERAVAWRRDRDVDWVSLEKLREQFLAEEGVDAAAIELEYRATKARMIAIRYERKAREISLGLTELSDKLDAANRVGAKAGETLFKTAPTTVKGMAALLDYALRSIADDLGETGNWKFRAIRQCIALMKARDGVA